MEQTLISRRVLYFLIDSICWPINWSYSYLNWYIQWSILSFDDKRILEKTSLWQIYDWVQKRTFQTRSLCPKSNKMVLALKPSFFNIGFYVLHRKKYFGFKTIFFEYRVLCPCTHENFFGPKTIFFEYRVLCPSSHENFFGLKNSFFEYRVLCPISVKMKMVTNSYFFKVGFYAQNRI